MRFSSPAVYGWESIHAKRKSPINGASCLIMNLDPGVNAWAKENDAVDAGRDARGPIKLLRQRHPADCAFADAPKI
jgi:hypothetical protein